MARLVSSLVVFASLALPALADVAPPPPANGIKRVDLEHVVKLETEIPEYKFFTFQRLRFGGRETIGEELKLGTKSGVPVPSSSSYSLKTGIIAVPQKVMDELKTKKHLAKLLVHDFSLKLPAGVVMFETQGVTADLKSSDPRTKVEKVITVSKDKKSGVRFTMVETGPKSSTGSPIGIFVATIALAMSIASLGFLITRHQLQPLGNVNLAASVAK